MKQSWIIAIVSLWIILTLLSNVAESTALMGTGEATTLQTLMTPFASDHTGIVDIGVSFITNVWNYFKLFIQVALLYYPTLWAGSAIFIYFILFMPVGIGFVVSIITILRGSSAG